MFISAFRLNRKRNTTAGINDKNMLQPLSWYIPPNGMEHLATN